MGTLIPFSFEFSAALPAHSRNPHVLKYTPAARCWAPTRKPNCFGYYNTLKGYSESGGDRRDRTVDLLHAMQALYQLSYTPERIEAF